MSFTSNTNIFKRCSKDIFSFPVKLKIGAQKQRLFSSRPCSARRPVGACQSWASATRPGRLGRQKNGHEIDGRMTCEAVKNERNDDSVNVCFCGKRFEKIWNVLKCENHSDIGLWHRRRTSGLGPGLILQRNIVLNFPSCCGRTLSSIWDSPDWKLRRYRLLKPFKP